MEPSPAATAAALFSWLFIGVRHPAPSSSASQLIDRDGRFSRADRGGVAQELPFWEETQEGEEPEKVVIGCRECGTRDVSGQYWRHRSEVT